MKWCALPKRKRYTKISNDLCDKLRSWIVNHHSVVTSPIANDTYIVKNEDGTQGHVPKLLLECSVRELHNDLIKVPEQGGLEGAVNDSGEIIISDTALRAHLPKNLKK